MLAGASRRGGSQAVSETRLGGGDGLEVPFARAIWYRVELDARCFDVCEIFRFAGLSETSYDAGEKAYSHDQDIAHAPD
jgi:hypothetical protein